MKISDLEKEYLIEKYKENKYLVYEKEPAKTGRSVHKYLCVLNIKDKAYFIDGFESTTKLEVIKQQIVDYVKSLKYDSDYFNPRMRVGYTEELIIHDYLGSLGFKIPKTSSSNEFYVLEDKNIYNYTSSKIELSVGLDAWKYYKDNKFNLPETVKIKLWCGDSTWIESTVKREVEAIKEGIDSLLKPLYLTDSVYNLNKSEELKNSKDIDLTLEGLTKDLEFVSMDYKQILKNKLEAVLETLK